MSSQIIAFSLILLPFFGFSQALDLREDLHKESDGKYYVDSTNVIYSGSAFAKYKTGEIGMEGSIKDGLFNELWTWWYINGTKKRETLYSNGKKNGYSYWWHKNGVKKMEVKYYNNNSISQQLWDEKGNEIPNRKF